MSLTNQQYDSILREYSRRQAEDRRLLDQRQKEVYTRLPVLKEMNRQWGQLALERAGAILSDRREEADRCGRQLKSLAEEKEELLRSAGYPIDYLEMPYQCPDCKDTGYTDGKKCHCFLQLEMQTLYYKDGFLDMIQKENFENFRLDLFDDRQPLPAYNNVTARTLMEGHLQTAQNFAAAFSQNSGNLLLTGPVGTGKTYLANCIAGDLIRQGYVVLYLSAQDFFEHMARQSFDWKNMPEEEDIIQKADLLVIDDLGTEIGGKFTEKWLFGSLNQRLLFKKSTIISTNLDMNRLAQQYSERIVSRIVGNYKLLGFAGADLRLKYRNI